MNDWGLVVPLEVEFDCRFFWINFHCRYVVLESLEEVLLLGVCGFSNFLGSCIPGTCKVLIHLIIVCVVESYTAAGFRGYLAAGKTSSIDRNVPEYFIIQR